MSETILRTPLHGSHVALGGKMVPFAGYDMPVQYQGIIAETLAVRNGAGMFDVSHMARLELRGERAFEFVEWITTNDVSKLGDGAGQYSLLPNDRGGCVDDIILYRVSGEPRQGRGVAQGAQLLWGGDSGPHGRNGDDRRPGPAGGQPVGRDVE